MAVGFGLGLFVAAQVGPVSLLVVRSVLRGSLRIGLAMAAAVGLPAASATTATRSFGASVALLGGVGLGTLTWYTAFSTAVSLARRRVGPRILTAVDVGAGAGIVGFGGLLGYRSLHRH